MKHLHFDVGTAGFYGAYWACAIRRIGLRARQ